MRPQGRTICHPDGRSTGRRNENHAVRPQNLPLLPEMQRHKGIALISDVMSSRAKSGTVGFFAHVLCRAANQNLGCVT